MQHILLAALLATLLGLAATNQAFAWGGYWGNGGGTGWCGYNCGGTYWGGGDYRYTVGYQSGVQDAQVGNPYSCDGHSYSYCAGYGAGYNSINQGITPQQQQGQEQQSGSTSYAQSNPHIVINNILPQPTQNYGLGGHN